jgi:hypothetical protein
MLDFQEIAERKKRKGNNGREMQVKYRKGVHVRKLLVGLAVN